MILRKELLWIHKRTQLMIRYTLLDAHSETTLRLRPFLAFRDKHALSKANMEADGHSYPAVNGVKCRLYGSFPPPTGIIISSIARSWTAATTATKT